VKKLNAAALFVLLVACGSLQLLEVQDSDFLYFGTTRPSGVVTDAEWTAFVEEVITPRFPGFTEWTAEGHWQQQREKTHIVQIVHLHRTDSERKIAEIIAAYKKQFAQEAVFWIRTRALAQAR
jgi:hypothetical protein